MNPKLPSLLLPLWLPHFAPQNNMDGRFPLRGGPRPRLIRPGGGFARPFGFGGFGLGLGRGLIGFGGEC